MACIYLLADNTVELAEEEARAEILLRHILVIHDLDERRGVFSTPARTSRQSRPRQD